MKRLLIVAILNLGLALAQEGSRIVIGLQAEPVSLDAGLTV